MSDIKLYHGYCFKLLDSIADNSIDLILTDIPYVISQENNFTTMKDRDGRNGIDFGKWDKEFDVSQLSVLASKLKQGGSFICFHSFEQFSKVKSALSDLEWKDFLIWEKTNPMPRNTDRRYVCNIECFSLYVKYGAPWTFHRINDVYDGCVHSYPSESGGGFERYHPCQKPQDLLVELIKRHSNIGDTVFDPFMGSGSVGLACLNTDRNFIGMELDDNYFHIAEERIKQAQINPEVPYRKPSNDGVKHKRLF